MGGRAEGAPGCCSGEQRGGGKTGGAHSGCRVMATGVEEESGTTAPARRKVGEAAGRPPRGVVATWSGSGERRPSTRSGRPVWRRGWGGSRRRRGRTGRRRGSATRAEAPWCATAAGGCRAASGHLFPRSRSGGARETRRVGRGGEWGALGFGFGRPGELMEWGGPARLEGWPAGPFGPVGQGGLSSILLFC